MLSFIRSFFGPSPKPTGLRLAKAAAVVVGRYRTPAGVDCSCKVMPPQRAPSARVQPRQLLTPNEVEFMGRLRQALPELLVAPQVSMGALIDVATKGDRSALEFFRGKICDYVLVCPRTGVPVAIIELDDRTHDESKDRARDVVVAAAGLPTIRFESTDKPGRESIRAAVADVGFAFSA